MGLFVGPDVEAKPSWLRNPWLLAALGAGLPIDLAIALVTGMPRLSQALQATDLPIASGTALVIGLGRFLADWWGFAVPPLVIAPLAAAWRLRDRAVPLLQLWLALLVGAFVAICLAILLPIRTILAAT